ncbi:hypothetical protein KKF81_06740 [Candidatus Micrarchaeota archaeon]|nr:hypothetical protein [Candidatus Micrarchaeota archaeon]
MKEIRCSLCNTVKNSIPLDMNDLVFGNYVRIMRKAGISKHNDNLGVCPDCKTTYDKMNKEYQKKKMIYLTIGLGAGLLYLYFTSNILASLIIFLFVFGLSVFSYCPPLKK